MNVLNSDAFNKTTNSSSITNIAQMLDLLCKNFNGETVRAKTIYEHFFKPRLKKLYSEILKVDSKEFLIDFGNLPTITTKLKKHYQNLNGYQSISNNYRIETLEHSNYKYIKNQRIQCELLVDEIKLSLPPSIAKFLYQHRKTSAIDGSILVDQVKKDTSNTLKDAIINSSYQTVKN